MKPLRIVYPWMAFLAGALFFTTPVWAEIQNRVVAIVNDEVVTLYELNSRIKQLTGVSSQELKAKSEQMYIETRRQVLDALIDQKIALEKVKELEIKVSPEEVDSAIERVKEDNQFTQEDLIAKLKEKGTTYESYRKTIKAELERMRLVNYEVQSKILIREEDLKKYYEEHIDEFTSGGKVHLALIFLKQTAIGDKNEARALHQKAQEIMTMINSGNDFGQLARKYSSGPGAREGGDLGQFKLSELNPEMAGLIKGLSSGEVAEPVVRPDGIRIIKVVERDPEGVKSFEQVRNAIQSTLYREELDRRYSAWIKELRKKAYTKIIF